MSPIVRAALVFVMFLITGGGFALLVRLVPYFLYVSMENIHAAMFAAIVVWTILGLGFSIWFYTKIS